MVQNGNKHFGTVDIMEIDILGVDILGIDILGIAILTPTQVKVHNLNLFEGLLKFKISSGGRSMRGPSIHRLVTAQGGTLIFSAYVGSDPASTVHPQKISGISNTPKNYLKF